MRGRDTRIQTAAPLQLCSRNQQCYKAITLQLKKKTNTPLLKTLLAGFSTTSTKTIPNWYTQDTPLCYVCYLLPLQADQTLFLLGSHWWTTSFLPFHFLLPLPITHTVCAVSSPSVVDSGLTLCDPGDCSPPGSSAHGDSPGKSTGVGSHALLQGSSQTWDPTQVSHMAGGFFIIWAIRDTHCVPSCLSIHCNIQQSNALGPWGDIPTSASKGLWESITNVYQQKPLQKSTL